VLDRLAAMDADESGGPFAHRLDLSMVGLVGFSIGGAVAAEASVNDPRFKAVMNMDGWHFGEVASRGVTQPYLLMSDDTPLPTPQDLVSPVANVRTQATLTDRDDKSSRANFVRHGGYYMVISGTRHTNFSDAPLRRLRERLVEAGPLDPRRALQIRNAYALEFFNKYLAGQPSPLLDAGEERYREVRLTKWRQEVTPPANSAADSPAFVAAGSHQ
jgi:predicted dienelactone hydrolase